MTVCAGQRLIAMCDANGGSTCAAFPSMIRFLGRSPRVFRSSGSQDNSRRRSPGRNDSLQYLMVPYEPVETGLEAHVGFSALSLHNERRICFWVYDKSHVGAVVNRPRVSSGLLIRIAKRI